MDSKDLKLTTASPEVAPTELLNCLIEGFTAIREAFESMEMALTFTQVNCPHCYNYHYPHCAVKTVETVDLLGFTQEEVQWLHAVLQNPLHDPLAE